MISKQIQMSKIQNKKQL